MNTRKPIYAGSWYPSGAAECKQQISRFLNDARFQPDLSKTYIAGVVPHAGWRFSGSLAANVIHALKDEADPDVLVLFGMHLPPQNSGYIMCEGAWETPFGDLEIDGQISRRLIDEFPFTIETADRFTPDNTIELQLPFVKYFFETARILPVGAPPTDTTLQMARRIVEIAANSELNLKIIGSTDLTHYGPNFGMTAAGFGRKAYQWVRDENDRRIIDLMLAMKPAEMIREGLSRHNACCAGAAAAAVSAAGAMGAAGAHLVGYHSSFEESPGDSFVGYAGILFES